MKSPHHLQASALASPYFERDQWAEAMMSVWMRSILLASAIALASCGGGGGDLASNPPPAVTPSPADTVIPGATSSQEFTVMGETVIDGSEPTLDADTQIRVRYEASTGTYEVLLPDAQDWQGIPSKITGPYNGGGFLLSLHGGDYQYSRLLSWNDGANSGQDAFGIPTPASGIPVTGSAKYSGEILGLTSEHNSNDFTFGGSISMSFDFGAGSLTGSLAPDLNLGSIQFRDTVYSTGAKTFSGQFDTDISGVNSFSGLFMGPHAEELIGNFAFPYQSPIDGKDYQANGAFVGAK